MSPGPPAVSLQPGTPEPPWSRRHSSASIPFFLSCHRRSASRSGGSRWTRSPGKPGPHSWAAGPSPRGAQGRVRPTASPWRRPSLSRGRDVATSGAASDGVNPRGPPLRVSEATGHRVDGGTELNVQRRVIDYGGTSTASSAASVRRRFVRSTLSRDRLLETKGLCVPACALEDTWRGRCRAIICIARGRAMVAA
jgi:hypothetical protein